MATGRHESKIGGRLVSLDAIRGLAVLAWILSATLAPVLYQLPPNPVVVTLAAQLSPSFWHGITVYDLVLPIFLFVAGASIVPAFERRKAGRQPNRRVAELVVRRVALLLAIGILCEGGVLQYWPNLRFVGGFQRIAICYAVAACLELSTGWRFQVGALGFLLLAYTLILAFGFAGQTDGAYSVEANTAATVDQLLLPGRKYFGTWDPQGILTTVPALAVMIAGQLVGRAILRPTIASVPSAMWLIGAGIVAINAGFLGEALVPIDPHLWTTTFCLIAIGTGLTLLGLFHTAIDVYGWTGGSSVLTALGRNSLVVVLATVTLSNAAELATRFTAPGARAILNVAPMWAPIILFVVGWVAFLLDRRKIYVTV